MQFYIFRIIALLKRFHIIERILLSLCPNLSIWMIDLYLMINDDLLRHGKEVDWKKKGEKGRFIKNNNNRLIKEIIKHFNKC